MGIIISSIVGILIGVLIEEPLKKAWKAILHKIKVHYYRPTLKPLPPKTFNIGRRQTSFLIIDGDGESTYNPDTIRCIVDANKLDLPQEIVELRAKNEKNETEKKAKGLQGAWNGPQYALQKFALDRTIPEENLAVTFTFKESDYYTFLATIMSLDKNFVSPPAYMTLRQKYFEGHNYLEPIPFLAVGFGVVLVIISKDNKLILTKRSPNAGARPGELDVSVVEGVHPILDRSTKAICPDLYRTAIRGAKEEAGIDIIENEISFLGFGVDTEYYQWNMIGTAQIQLKANEVAISHARGTSGKWETKDFVIIDSNPQEAFSYLKDKKIWSMGMIAIYWTLVRLFGKAKVDKEAAVIFK
jgi:hypothetical protein